MVCFRCQQIPFENLPDFDPSQHCTHSSVRSKSGVEYFLRDESSISSSNEAFILHENINALKTTSTSCRLCQVIWTAVQRYWAVRKPFDSSVYISKMPDGFTKYIPAPLKQGLAIYLGPGSSHGQKWYTLVAALGVSVDSNDLLRDTFFGRHISSYGGSQAVDEFLSSCLQQCAKRHPDCYKKASQCPTRILDILDCDDLKESTIVRLRETKSEVGEYAALSYCWGTSGHLMTTRENMQELKTAGIPLARLPKTMRDAVMLSQRLKINKLWIDALCICQDDKEDWEHESSEMTSVYSNAFVTIAACSANQSEGGCFNDRMLGENIEILYESMHNKRGIVHVFEYDLERSDPYENLRMSNEPLSSRAWTLQERTLARRIIHLSSDQAYFECADGTSAEDGSHYDFRYMNLYNTASNDSFDGKPEHDMWYRLVENYSNRHLTIASDKFPALSGLARIFEHRTKADYVAGLWSDDLIHGLTWEPTRSFLDGGNIGSVPRSDPSPYIAPSWSWASYKDAVRFPPSRGNPLVSVQDYGTSPASTNSLGEIDDAWITLQGFILPVKHCMRHHKNMLFHDGGHVLCVDLPDNDTSPAPTTLECQMLDPFLFQQLSQECSLFAMPISTIPPTQHMWSDARTLCYALILGMNHFDPEKKVRRLAIVPLRADARLFHDFKYKQVVTLH